MTDVHSMEQRSFNMSRIRANKTKPELTIKKGLRGLGFSYQPNLIGKPDFANKKLKIAIFIDGCFWHKCPKCYIQPQSNKEFWISKIIQNQKRDRKVNRILKKEGWAVIRIWEHDVRKSYNKCIKKISAKMEIIKCLSG